MEFPWLTYCTTFGTVFCFHCREAKSKKLLTFSKCLDNAFITTGFNNWKKAKEKFKDHEKSHCHQEATLKLKASRGPSVIAIANSGYAKTQEWRRTMFLKQLSSLKLLLRQGLPIRGHIDITGNLYQLMKCRCEDVPQLCRWLENKDYQSPEVVNELINLMAKEVLRGLVFDINSVRYFSLIADETRDMSGKEQLAITIRWVNDNYDVFEDLIGLAAVDKTDANFLVSIIKFAMESWGIKLEKCRGQAYDGAANMAGHLNGVAAQIKRDEPRALFVHCLAHSVNLCLQESGKQSRPISDALTLVNELYNFIQLSPKRLALFNTLKGELAPGNPTVKPLCPTRWTVRTPAISAVIKNYSVLLQEMETIQDEFSGEASTKAAGLFSLMKKFRTYFGLKLAYLIFVSVEQLATTLQAKDVNAQICLESGLAAKNFLSRHRTDDYFNILFKSAVADSENITDKPVLPRQKRVPKRIDDGSSGHSFTCPEDYHRSQYFEAVDIILNELDSRFDQRDLAVLKEIENLLINSINMNITLPSTELKELYKDDINFSSLETQLYMLPDFLKTCNDSNEAKIKTVTSIHTICDLMNNSTFGKSMFTEIHKLLTIYLTVPMTSATAERSFSALRRVKDYTRTTMTQQRLNHVIIMHTHKQRTDDLNLVNVAESFISVSPTRTAFFGHFK